MRRLYYTGAATGQAVRECESLCFLHPLIAASTRENLDDRPKIRVGDAELTASEIGHLHFLSSDCVVGTLRRARLAMACSK